MSQTKKLTVLLTALGTQPKRTLYSFRGKIASAEYAPLALLDLLSKNDQPDIVFTLLTSRARETVWDDFKQSVQNRKHDTAVEDIDIPDCDEDKEVVKVIEKVARVVPPGARLILDITHGPRHIPFVFYALALYLSAFRDVEILGAWYGKYESSYKEKPIISLQPLLYLPQWFYAIRVFADTGATGPLSNQFKRLEESLPKGPERGQPKKVAKVLNEFSTNYERGLPLELGLVAGELAHQLEQYPLEQLFRLNVPMRTELGKRIIDTAAPFRFAEDTGLDTGRGSAEWKRSLVLTREELRRQARLIDCYVDRDQWGQALAMMREWVVSLGMLYRGQEKKWLQREARSKFERKLNTTRELSKGDVLNDKQREWATFWDSLTQLRNALAHSGMTDKNVRFKYHSILDFWNEIKSADYPWTYRRWSGTSARIATGHESRGTL